jgi:RNA polymerase-binding transcription factor DksA
MKINTEIYKKALEKELKILEAELKSVGRKNPDNSKDWEPRATDVDIEASDSADTADNIENYESNTEILKPLETQYNDVKLALDKIAKGTYGMCEVDEKPIDAARLNANPSARTCIAHSFHK